MGLNNYLGNIFIECFLSHNASRTWKESRLHTDEIKDRDHYIRISLHLNFLVPMGKNVIQIENIAFMIYEDGYTAFFCILCYWQVFTRSDSREGLRKVAILFAFALLQRVRACVRAKYSSLLPRAVRVHVMRHYMYTLYVHWKFLHVPYLPASAPLSYLGKFSLS